MTTKNVNLTVRTTGGLWSKKVTDVNVTRLKWETEERDDGVHETFVNVYFDPETWNTSNDGLLYTDEGFEEGLRAKVLELVEEGKLPKELPWKDISYTEQGMQDEHYVHMILGDW